jgi:PA14 domain
VVATIIDVATSISVQTILGAVVGATGYRYGVRDSAGNVMDTAKIIANPQGGYLSVYHTGQSVHLATSTDLLTWTFRRTLDQEATQPTIQALPTGGFLTAVEHNRAGSGGQLRLRHYASLSALLAGNFNRERTIPRTLSACNEGTPNINSVSLTPDIDNSVIDVGFHYHESCNVDRQARGVLTNFTNWTAAADSGRDSALIAAAAAQGQSVNGNIGDRDVMMFDNIRYSLYEVQYVKNDFGSWRAYLYNWQTGSAAYLPITTHGGSVAFANPTFTTVTAPSGNPAVVATMFLPSEGAASGEAGQLVYYREYATTPNPATGLSATYFDNLDFTGSTLVRTDPQVDFDFGTSAPSPNLGPDQFAVRWCGQVLADRTETYTFYTQTDDGARLWVNGVQLVDDWTDHGIVENSGSIPLVAGRKYDIRMEYYDNGANGFAKLLWSSPGTPKAVIPADHLFPPNNGLTGNYFAGIALNGAARTRPDPSVNFNWGPGFADPNVGRDLFSVRWTGRVRPQFNETYRFYTNSDDGVRLWVNNVQLINNWTDHGPTENSGTIALRAGRQYDLRMEYYERGGGALVQLFWSSPSVPKQIIPREFLTPG